MTILRPNSLIYPVPHSVIYCSQQRNAVATDMSKQLRVLVVGASIAGPSTAYWLAKAGASVTIIERFPSLRRGGQNIDIRNVGVSVMRKIPGMEENVKAKVLPLEGMSLVRTNGRSYGVMKATGNADQQSLVSEYEIYRDDLARIIYDITKDNENIKYVFDEQVASIHQTNKDDEDGPVTVEFANGRLPPSEFDLVVACDGATSRTRDIGLGCKPKDFTEPMGAWAAYYSTKSNITGGSKLGEALSAPGGRFFAIGLDQSTGCNRVTLMKFEPLGSTRGQDGLQRFRKAQKAGTAALKQFVAEEYKGVPWLCKEAMESIEDADDFYASELIQVKPPSLFKGRFALVGDAGYGGSPGAGTSLAIAGAYFLAGEICKHPGDLEAGLRGYEEQMRPLIRDMQQPLGFVPTCMAPQSAWGITVRNNIWWFLVRMSGALHLFQKLFGGAFAGTDKYSLPEYKWIE